MINILTPELVNEPELGNVPILRFHHNDLTVEGYSRAAVQTYWRIPQFRLGFDHGNHPHSFSSINHMALSHGHADHICGLMSFLTTRVMLHLPPPKIYLPTPCVAPFKNILAGWNALTTDELPCEIIACEPGDSVDIDGHRYLQAIRTHHSAPSCGYIVYERVTKLMPDFQAMSSDEISDLAQQGISVSERHDRPVIAYVGDSTTQVFESNPLLFEVPILITEVTYPLKDGLDARAIEVGHTHLNRFLEIAPNFANQRLIIGHFTLRYRRSEILQSLAENLPTSLDGRVVAWI